ncbi:hypothetical protein H4R19_002560 [Coemansia spiralis]|nr:hypothetical protein H4R19_002560 [Coemansia spiralis]
MQLNDLPEDILAIVLYQRLYKSSDRVLEFKDNLPLLAVCRLWRRLAIPMVYANAHIQYGGGSQYKGRLPVSEEEPADVMVKTNLDLIAKVGCARAVKRIQIAINCLANPFPGWRDILHRMRAVESQWRVVELNIAMHPNHRRDDPRRLDVAKHADDIAEVGDALVGLMPDVRRLICDESTIGPIEDLLYGRLAGCYAGQLQGLNCCNTISMPPECQLTRLQAALINHRHGADYPLPRIASGELIDLALANIPASHSWAPFSTGSDSRVIEFTKLKTLSTRYYSVAENNGAPVRHRDGHPWELHFPSLAKLSIYCAQDICSLLEYAVLPPRMESISVEVEPAVLYQLANTGLPATKKLSLVIPWRSGGDPTVLHDINRLLEGVHENESVELRIDDEELPVVPESITCTALTSLSINWPTSIDNMLAFIEKLPKLQVLTFYSLDTSDIQADISVPEAEANATITPLSTSLKALAINYDRERLLPDKAVAVAKYMLLRLPTLVKLFAVQTPREPMLGFVAAYAPQHPHVGGVEMELDDGRNTATSWTCSRAYL